VPNQLNDAKRHFWADGFLPANPLADRALSHPERLRHSHLSAKIDAQPLELGVPGEVVFLFCAHGGQY